jgi:chromosome partitioning protein
MICVFANMKGGVGKTTLAVHVAVRLHDERLRVALVDGDGQGSSSQWIVEAEPNITVVTTASPDACVAVIQELRANHDVIVCDAPGGINDVSRTMLLMSDLALFPITPSILDLRSVSQATEVLRYAQAINGGRPVGRLLLNKMRKRDTISRDLETAAPELGLSVARTTVRDLQAYREAAQQATVVTRMGLRGREAAAEVTSLCQELLDVAQRVAGPRRQRESSQLEVANG